MLLKCVLPSHKRKGCHDVPTSAVDFFGPKMILGFSGTLPKITTRKTVSHMTRQIKITEIWLLTLCNWEELACLVKLESQMHTRHSGYQMTQVQHGSHCLCVTTAT